MTIKMQDSTKFRPQVRPPRLGGNQKIGVFATRKYVPTVTYGLIGCAAERR